jgi:hypothetical protein
VADVDTGCEWWPADIPTGDGLGFSSVWWDLVRPDGVPPRLTHCVIQSPVSVWGQAFFVDRIFLWTGGAIMFDGRSMDYVRRRGVLSECVMLTSG